MTAPFADIAVALSIQASDLELRAFDADKTAREIGLFANTREHIVDERRNQAALIRDAYHVIRALMPLENTIKAVIEEGT